jgi:hypothetical protein
MRLIERKKSEPQIGPGLVQEFPVDHEVGLDSRFSVVLDCEEAKSKNSNEQKRIYRIRPEWLGFVVVIVIYGLSAWLTWRKWPDLLVDFGEQLYLPWRISLEAFSTDVTFTGGRSRHYTRAFQIIWCFALTLIVRILRWPWLVAVGVSAICRMLGSPDGHHNLYRVILVLAFGLQRDRELQLRYPIATRRGTVLSNSRFHFCVPLQKVRPILSDRVFAPTGLYDETDTLHRTDAGTCLRTIAKGEAKRISTASKLFVWSLPEGTCRCSFSFIFVNSKLAGQRAFGCTGWVPLPTSVSKSSTNGAWAGCSGFHTAK